MDEIIAQFKNIAGVDLSQYFANMIDNPDPAITQSVSQNILDLPNDSNPQHPISNSEIKGDFDLIAGQGGIEKMIDDYYDNNADQS